MNTDAFISLFINNEYLWLTLFLILSSVMTVPPERPVITDMTGEPLHSLIGPYNEGDRLGLVCSVEGGQPKPQVTWWREGVLLDESSEVTPSGHVTRNELELPTLARHDLMAVFTCQASNNNISAPLSASVTVDMNCE